MKKIIKNILMLAAILCIRTAQGQVEPTIGSDKSIMASNNFTPSTTGISLTNSKAADEVVEVEREFPSVILGIRYMPTFTSLNYHHSEDGTVSTSFVLGHGFGGLVGVNFTDHIGLQAEAIYLALAQKYTSNEVEHTVKLSYVNVPLLFVLNTGYSRPVNFNVCVGPQVGINTGSKIETSGNHEGDTLQAVLAVKPADLGIAYGAGFDFGPPNFKISIGFRGVYGLIDVSDNSNNITTDQYYVLDRAHVKTYSGYIGLAFGF
jgi:hypothetical protein